MVRRFRYKLLIITLISFILINIKPYISYCENNKSNVIKVGWCYLPGYMDKKQDGSYSGYIYDYLIEIKGYTGWEYEFVDGTYENLYNMLINKEIDILAPISPLKGIDDDITYTRLAIGEESMALFTRVDSKLAKNDYMEFNNITIAASSKKAVSRLTGFASDHNFRVNIKYYDRQDEVINAVINKEVDAGLSGCYYSNDTTRSISNFASGPFYFGTNRDNKELISKLNTAIRSIKLSNPEYEHSLKNKYVVDEESYFTLTEAEKEFIKSSDIYKVSYTKDWKPYEDFKKNGDSIEFIGVVANVFKRIEEITGLKFEYYPTDEGSGIIDGTDIVSSFESNNEIADDRGYNITIPYLQTSVSLVKKDNNSSTNVKTAASKYYSSIHNIVKDESLIKYYDTPKECIEAIENGEVNQAVISSLFANNMLDKFKYRSYYSIPLKSQNLSLSIGVRDDIDQTLVNILNKSIAYIYEEDIDNIIIDETLSAKEISLKNLYENMSLEVIIVVLIILLTIILILAYAVLNRDRYLRNIKRLLYYDNLTGLLSRIGFEKKVREKLKEDKENFYILYINIINFSSYNMINGRDEGDEYIKNIGRIAKNDSSEYILAARIYADNFVLLVKDDDVTNLVDKIQCYISKYKYSLSKTVSEPKFGLYKIEDTSISISNMIDCAIIAERSIKDRHDEQIAVYDNILHNEKLKKDELVSYFDTAIENNEFIVYYQPKYDTFSEEVVGAEALVRWNRCGKLVYPNEFIDIFETRGIISKLDYYMFEKVCIKQKEFIDNAIIPVPISVNFSRANLYDISFTERLQKIINKYNVPASFIEIEFTEGALIQDIKSIYNVLMKLKNMNFIISIDDFGSGYSSLNALKDLPANVLKIDRGFLTYIHEDDDFTRVKGELILKTIINLAKELNMKTVVEGVEDMEQLVFLRECKCDIIQGYIFSKPIPQEEFEKLIKNKNLL